MPISFVESQQEVTVLVRQFHTNLSCYRSPGYKEAEARQDFIDPLFMALGWDVPNRQHLSPLYKVDAEFLKDIERWRELLARNIALRNLKLSLDDLNDMVQREM